MAKVTVQDLLEAGVHFGHQTKRWNPKMSEYVYGVKNGIYIIDLGKTMHQLAGACNFLQHKVAEGGEVLFVGTKRQAQEVVRDAADHTDSYFITERWLGGTLTNNATIQRSVTRMQEIDKQLENSETSSMKKKEISSITRQGNKLHRNLDGIWKMKKLPAALVIVDVCHEHIAVAEASKLGIPIVAIVDTNANPDKISYPIVANDDAVKSISVIVKVLADAIKAASELYAKKAAEMAKQAAEEKAKLDAEKAKEKEEKAKQAAEKKAAADKEKKAVKKEKKAPEVKEEKKEAKKEVKKADDKKDDQKAAKKEDKKDEKAEVKKADKKSDDKKDNKKAAAKKEEQAPKAKKEETADKADKNEAKKEETDK